VLHRYVEVAVSHLPWTIPEYKTYKVSVIVRSSILLPLLTWKVSMQLPLPPYQGQVLDAIRWRSSDILGTPVSQPWLSLRTGLTCELTHRLCCAILTNEQKQ
jgi:hypothetical protein